MFVLKVYTKYREGESKTPDNYYFENKADDETVEDYLDELYSFEMNFNEGWRGYRFEWEEIDRPVGWYRFKFNNLDFVLSWECGYWDGTSLNVLRQYGATKYSGEYLDHITFGSKIVMPQ